MLGGIRETRGERPRVRSRHSPGLDSGADKPDLSPSGKSSSSPHLSFSLSLARSRSFPSDNPHRAYKRNYFTALSNVECSAGDNFNDLEISREKEGKGGRKLNLAVFIFNFLTLAAFNFIVRKINENIIFNNV